MQLENIKWSEDKFLKARNLVLRNTHQESIIPPEQYYNTNNFALKLQTARENGNTLIQCLVDAMDSGAAADSELYCISEKSISQNKLKPYANMCFQTILDHSDNKLFMEYGISSGFTSFLGGWISQCLFGSIQDKEAYYVDWQYCDRLAGYYEEKGLMVNREFIIPECGRLITPGYSNAIVLMEALQAAEQGVKSITLSYRGTGNFIQDSAAIIALREQSGELFRYKGYNDVSITIGCYMKKNHNVTKASAVALSSYCAAVAYLTGAVKTGITQPFISESAGAADEAIKMLHSQKIHYSNELELEITAIKLETKLIMDKVGQQGERDMPVEICKALSEGLLDISSAEIVMLSDKSIRYLNFGNIPVNYELKCYNKKKLKENIL